MSALPASLCLVGVESFPVGWDWWLEEQPLDKRRLFFSMDRDDDFFFFALELQWLVHCESSAFDIYRFVSPAGNKRTTTTYS